MAATWLARHLWQALGYTRPAALLVLTLFLAAISTYRLGHQLTGILAAGLGLAALGCHALPKLATRRRLRLAVARPRSRSGIPRARETLRRLGLDESKVAELVAAAGDGELTIAELDQNNGVLSHIGPIPLFAEITIDRESFRRRSRNRMQVVMALGALAVKKNYSDGRRFVSEVCALDALDEIEEVPTLLKVESAKRVTYQALFPGRNLGSLMAQSGATVSAQYQLGKRFGDSPERLESDQREEVILALRRTVDVNFIAALQRLIVRVHQKGVLLRDVKHGNVIVCEEGPRLCDFDLSRIFRKTGVMSVIFRGEDRERFNFLFGGDLLTPAGFRRELDSWMAHNADFPYPGVYFGKGYRFGHKLTVDGGTGKWLLMRRHLPDIGGKCVVDLSCDAGVFSLELLRSGASCVRLHALDRRLAELAGLHHRFFEFVDNRDYDFRVCGLGSDREPWGSLAAGLDEIALVTVVQTPYASARDCWQRAVGFVQRHAARIRSVAIECDDSGGRSSQAHVPRLLAPEVTGRLAEIGFANRRVVRVRPGRRLLVIGRR